MQTPCSRNCLPTGPHGHEPACPKPNHKRHCTDCRGYFPEFDGDECSICHKFWCTDEALVFFKLEMCEHFDWERNRPQDEKALLVPLSHGICPQCAFSHDVDFFCHEPTCALSWWIFLANWVKFCSSRVVFGKYELTRRQKEVSNLVIYFHRRVNLATPTALWEINDQVFWLDVDGETFTFKTIEAALETARNQIQEKLDSGFQPTRTHIGGSAGTGALYHTRLFPEKQPATRDASPKRQ